MSPIDKNVSKKDLTKWSITKLRETLWNVNVDRKKAWVGYFKHLKRVKVLEQELEETKKLLDEANQKIKDLENNRVPAPALTPAPAPAPAPVQNDTTDKNQKYCEVCQTNVSRKNFSAHCRTKKHIKNAEN